MIDLIDAINAIFKVHKWYFGIKKTPLFLMEFFLYPFFKK